MRPSVLTLIGAAILLVSSVVMAVSGPPSTLPEGVLAEDTITVIVGDAGILPITGAELGLLIGAGLLLVSLGWYLARRRRQVA